MDENSLYSLRWNNHHGHIMESFDLLRSTETLVDVSLVCSNGSVRAHRVVLSACSPFFERVFSENPCRHPVIVLKDFTTYEIQTLVHFMYKGEVNIEPEQLNNLMKAAENLQVRGLAQHPEDFSSVRTPTPSMSPSYDFDKNYCGRLSMKSPYLPETNNHHQVKLPHMSRIAFPESYLARPDCQSPIARRKQARPRRRSGEMCCPQDLTKPSPPPPPPTVAPVEEIAENLSMKRPRLDTKSMVEERKATPERMDSPEMDLSMPGGGNSSKDFRTSPPVSLPPTLSMKQEIDNHSPLPFPPMPSVSALAMTPPHSKFFGLDSPLGLFPPGLDACRNTIFDLPDPRTTPDPQLFVKKKMGRPKGQHSAPRGGPPRSWTNAELTEALQHVWNKKMTTSQASRIFGIPYNSLLMYVRGKYGKSLKLEQLRKDCIGGPPPSMDLLGMGNNNNNSCKNDQEQPPNTRPPSTEEPTQQQPQQHPPPMFSAFHNFYPDFGTTFPIPVSMIHLLPQSEKSRDHYGQQPGLEDECSKNERVKKELEDEEMFRAPALSVDDRRELVQQNGQD